MSNSIKFFKDPKNNNLYRFTYNGQKCDATINLASGVGHTVFSNRKVLRELMDNEDIYMPNLERTLINNTIWNSDLTVVYSFSNPYKKKD